MLDGPPQANKLDRPSSSSSSSTTTTTTNADGSRRSSSSRSRSANNPHEPGTPFISRLPVCVVGPYWPVMLCVTLPLVVGISAAVGFFVAARGAHVALLAVLGGVGGVTAASLLGTACRNPGLLPRYDVVLPPPVSSAQPRGGGAGGAGGAGADAGGAGGEGTLAPPTPTPPTPPFPGWVKNDRLGVWRPPRAIYCSDCDVVVAEFDHTCPWTGTAIGRGNMRAFTTFVSSCGALVVYVLFVLFVMLVFYHSDAE